MQDVAAPGPMRGSTPPPLRGRHRRTSSPHHGSSSSNGGSVLRRSESQGTTPRFMDYTNSSQASLLVTAHGLFSDVSVVPWSSPRKATPARLVKTRHSAAARGPVTAKAGLGSKITASQHRGTLHGDACLLRIRWQQKHLRSTLADWLARCCHAHNVAACRAAHNLAVATQQQQQLARLLRACYLGWRRFTDVAKGSRNALAAENCSHAGLKLFPYRKHEKADRRRTQQLRRRHTGATLHRTPRRASTRFVQLFL
jgi:hypothetical protein